MRFGFFIPQGWRLDLVDIEVEKHWAVMRDLAAYADDKTIVDESSARTALTEVTTE